MKYYVGQSKRDKDFIIISESMHYYWYNKLPTYLDLGMLIHDGTMDIIEDWLEKVTNSIIILTSFKNYESFKREYPELFI